MKKKLITSAVVLVILAVVTMTILYFVGDKMIDSIFDSEIDSLLDEEEMSINTEDDEKVQKGNKEENSSNYEQAGTAEVIDEDSSVPASDEEKNTATDSVKKTKNVINKNADVSNASGSAKGINETDNNDKSPKAEENGEQKIEAKNQFATNDIKEVKDSVTPTDKISIAAMLLKKLSASDINELKSMLSGGVTAAEKQRAKEIAYKRFSEEEIKEIYKIYRKYVYGQ